MVRKECWGESLKHCDPPLIVLVIVAIYQLVGLIMTVWVLFFVIHMCTYLWWWLCSMMTCTYIWSHHHFLDSHLSSDWMALHFTTVHHLACWLEVFSTAPPPPSSLPTHTPLPQFSLSLHSACTKTHIHTQSQHAHTHTHTTFRATLE